MIEIIDFLSGEVPGGILLLILILFIINLIFFFFYKGSKLLNKKQYKDKIIKSSLFLLVVYISLWFLLSPPKIPDSVIFLPFQNGNTADFTICEMLERQLESNLSGDYRLHYWDWFYETCNQDSINNINYRNNVAKRLNIGLIISGRYIADFQVELSADDGNGLLTQQFEYNSFRELSGKIVSWLQDNYQITKPVDKNKIQISDESINIKTKAKLLYLNSKYDSAIKLLSKTKESHVLLKAMINLRKGASFLKENKKSMFEDNTNTYFAEIIDTLIPIAVEGKDTATLNKILGELYLYNHQYEKSEIFLKKALTQNPYDARIYYLLYYLHKDRIVDLGFNNRFEVLQKAIDLDNGYVLAVYDLANEYFHSGTATPTGTGTTFAIETLKKIMKINPNNIKILNLLANIYLQIKDTEKAIQIYNELIKKGDHSGEIYYNLGIGYFHLQKYDQAGKAFEKSISINEYPNSYLYLAAINKINGHNEKALYYYRERIKRKQGEDDMYAKEAMRGIRQILKEQAQDSIKLN